MKYEERHPSKVRYLSKIAEMFSSALTAQSVQKQKRYQICLVLGIYELGVDKKMYKHPLLNSLTHSRFCMFNSFFMTRKVFCPDKLRIFYIGYQDSC